MRYKTTRSAGGDFRHQEVGRAGARHPVERMGFLDRVASALTAKYVKSVRAWHIRTAPGNLRERHVGQLFKREPLPRAGVHKTRIFASPGDPGSTRLKSADGSGTPSRRNQNTVMRPDARQSPATGAGGVVLPGSSAILISAMLSHIACAGSGPFATPAGLGALRGAVNR